MNPSPDTATATGGDPAAGMEWNRNCLKRYAKYASIR